MSGNFHHNCKFDEVKKHITVKHYPNFQKTNKLTNISFV